MKQKDTAYRPEDLPRHMCAVVLGGDCDAPGRPRHEMQMLSRDDFAVLAAVLLKRMLTAEVTVDILDVDTVLGRAEVISEEEAHRRFAPACLKSSPGKPPSGGLPKANSRDN